MKEEKKIQTTDSILILISFTHPFFNLWWELSMSIQRLLLQMRGLCATSSTHNMCRLSFSSSHTYTVGIDLLTHYKSYISLHTRYISQPRLQIILAVLSGRNNGAETLIYIKCRLKSQNFLHCAWLKVNSAEYMHNNIVRKKDVILQWLCLVSCIHKFSLYSCVEARRDHTHDLSNQLWDGFGWNSEFSGLFGGIFYKWNANQMSAKC